MPDAVRDWPMFRTARQIVFGERSTEEVASKAAQRLGHIFVQGLWNTAMVFTRSPMRAMHRAQLLAPDCEYDLVEMATGGVDLDPGAVGRYRNHVQDNRLFH